MRLLPIERNCRQGGIDLGELPVLHPGPQLELRSELDGNFRGIAGVNWDGDGSATQYPEERCQPQRSVRDVNTHTVTRAHVQAGELGGNRLGCRRDAGLRPAAQPPFVETTRPTPWVAGVVLHVGQQISAFGIEQLLACQSGAGALSTSAVAAGGATLGRLSMPAVRMCRTTISLGGGTSYERSSGMATQRTSR